MGNEQLKHNKHDFSRTNLGEDGEKIIRDPQEAKKFWEQY